MRHSGTAPLPGSDDREPPSRPISELPPGLPAANDSQRQRRLRTRRIRTEDLKLGRLGARARHATLGNIECAVEDLSLTGMALIVKGPALGAALVLMGDRLERLEVTCDAGFIYEGSANVRRVSQGEGALVLGIELESNGIDLARLYRMGTQHSFGERLKVVLEGAEDELSQEFKAWVADLRTYLERSRAFLEGEQRALEDLDSYSREQALAAYLEEAAPQVVARLASASRELAALVGHLGDDQHAPYRTYYKSHLLPLMQESPLLRRSFTKPLGHAGDYEVMNMLYRDHAEGASLFGRVLNMYAGQEPVAQGVVNRLDYLGSKIQRGVEVRGRLRIASIGCGPAREITRLLEQRPDLGKHLEIALIDQEERVLTFCERTLAPLANQTGAKIHFIRESVRHLLTARELRAALGERDLIYSAGLFDYLNQRSFASLLGTLYEALVPSGHLIVGNVAMNNPSRYFMEYCLEWYLIHRTPADLLAFAAELRPAPSRATVESEPLGVNLFLNVWK